MRAMWGVLAVLLAWGCAESNRKPSPAGPDAVDVAAPDRLADVGANEVNDSASPVDTRDAWNPPDAAPDVADSVDAWNPPDVPDSVDAWSPPDVAGEADTWVPPDVAADVVAFPAPTLALVQPEVVCVAQSAASLSLIGSGFLNIGGVLPTVTVGTEPLTAGALTDCEEVEEPASALSCTGLTVELSQGLFEPGSYSVAVTNPSPADNATGEDVSISIVGAPALTQVMPPQLCVGGGMLTLVGEGFVEGAAVSVENLEMATTLVSSESLEAVLEEGLQPGLYDVSVTNPGGCAETIEEALTIVPNPSVLFVEPAVLPSALNLEVEAYVSGLVGAVTAVTLHPVGEPGSAQGLDFTFEPAEPNRIQLVVPAGLAPGQYALTVTDEGGCAAELEDAVSVVAGDSVAIDRIDPPFGWTGSNTRVGVYSTEDVEAGEVNFAATPLLFLTPTDGGEEAVATALRFTSFLTPVQLSAVVEGGLSPGSYDLVALNPDGGVGILPDAFKVTAAVPPTITDVTPFHLVLGNVEQVIVSGDHFEPTASVTVTCRQQDLSEVDLAVTIVEATSQAIELSIDMGLSMVTSGAVCRIRVTNGDGAYADYSALGVTNPSLNLSPFSTTSAMVTPRRALCGAAVEVRPGERFLYAVGGDDGTTQNAAAESRYDTIEFARLGPYGDLGGFQLQPVVLPAPRSFHGCAQLGRAIYVVGGRGPQAAEATVFRATVLDPDDAPMVEEAGLSVVPGEASLLGPGLYSYRIAAVMPVDDPDNPGGETLAGDALLVQVPDVLAKFAVSLTWSEVAGAGAYRIYRTPAPNLPSGDVVLLAEIPPDPPAYVDDGSIAPGNAVPLPVGATGKFVTLPAMGTAREGAGVVLTEDPANASLWHLYALGGRDAEGTALASVEWLDITVTGEGTQSPAAEWTQGAATIGTPRWQLRGLLANEVTAPNAMPEGQTWLYATSGISGDLGQLVPDVVGARVAPGGALGEGPGAWWQVKGIKPARAGYSGVLIHDMLIVLGGQGANPTDSISATEMCTNDFAACAGGAPGVPDLVNWNAMGLTMKSPRYLSGDTVVSTFTYILGGLDGAWQPQATTERTH